MMFRKGTIFDLKSVLKIEKKVYNKPYWTESMLKRLFNKDSNEIIWITEVKQKIVGYLIEQRCDNEINLLNVAIDKSFQNQGIGKKMMDYFLNHMRERGSKGLHLGLGIQNYRAFNFYKKYGMTELNRDSDSIIMGILFE